MIVRLPQIGPVVLPTPGPTPSRCPDRVRETDGDVTPVSGESAQAPVSGRALFNQACHLLGSAFFPEGDAPPPTMAQVLWAMRVFFQLVLMFFGIPTNLQTLAHTPNAQTALVPAIDCSLRFADVITREDPRIKKSVDFAVVARQRGALLDLRELLKLGSVFCQCVEAGTTHVEQYLDGVARFVYKKMSDTVGEDTLLQQDLDPLVQLVSAPIAAGQDARKTNARLTAAAEQKGEAKVLEQLTQAPPSAPPVVASATTAPVVAPRLATPPSPAAARRTKKRS